MSGRPGQAHLARLAVERSAADTADAVVGVGLQEVLEPARFGEGIVVNEGNNVTACTSIADFP